MPGKRTPILVNIIDRSDDRTRFINLRKRGNWCYSAPYEIGSQRSPSPKGV